MAYWGQQFMGAQYFGAAYVHGSEAAGVAYNWMWVVRRKGRR